jgi:hypothetical protein
MTDTILADLEAIIPVGLWRQPDDADRPAELGLCEGRSHLDRMLTELVAAGVGSAIIAVSDRLFNPRWLGRALRETTIRIPEDMSVDILVVEGARSIDDLVLSALTHTVTGWVAVASPLHSMPGFTAMSQVIATAGAEGLAAVALAEAAWETAIQLCQPLCDGAIVTGIRTHAAQGAAVTVFAGRAVFPATRLIGATHNADFCVMDYERLILGLCADPEPLRAYAVGAEVTDCRFDVPDRPEARMSRVSGPRRFAAAAIM